MNFSARICRVCDHTFFEDNLCDSSIVVDLGANCGEFARSMVKRFNTRVLAVEANPNLVAQLESTDRITYVNAAICDRNSDVSFNLSSFGECHSLLSVPKGTELETVQVQGLTLEALFLQNMVSKVDLLKVDIEGAELVMFAAASDEILRGIGQITIEFHDFLGLISSEEIDKLVNRLKSLDFDVVKFSMTNFDVLFVNRSLVPISRLRLLWAKTFSRVLLGLQKRIGRRLKGRKKTRT